MRAEIREQIALMRRLGMIIDTPDRIPRFRPISETERLICAGRRREAQLIEEAEEAARLTRWRRRQLEAISKAS
jgi:hypothetical protein